MKYNWLNKNLFTSNLNILLKTNPLLAKQLKDFDYDNSLFSIKSINNKAYLYPKYCEKSNYFVKTFVDSLTINNSFKEFLNKNTLKENTLLLFYGIEACLLNNLNKLHSNIAIYEPSLISLYYGLNIYDFSVFNNINIFTSTNGFQIKYPSQHSDFYLFTECSQIAYPLFNFCIDNNFKNILKFNCYDSKDRVFTALNNCVEIINQSLNIRDIYLRDFNNLKCDRTKILILSKNPLFTYLGNNFNKAGFTAINASHTDFKTIYDFLSFIHNTAPSFILLSSRVAFDDITTSFTVEQYVRDMNIPYATWTQDHLHDYPSHFHITCNYLKNTPYYHFFSVDKFVSDNFHSVKYNNSFLDQGVAETRHEIELCEKYLNHEKIFDVVAMHKSRVNNIHTIYVDYLYKYLKTIDTENVYVKFLKMCLKVFGYLDTLNDKSNNNHLIDHLSNIIHRIPSFQRLDDLVSLTRINNIKLKIFGDSDFLKIIPHNFYGGHLTEEEIKKNRTLSKITVVASCATSTSSPNKEVYKAFLAGSLVLSPLPVFQNFKEDDAFRDFSKITYVNQEDLKSKINFYLMNVDERIKVIKSAIIDIKEKHLLSKTCNTIHNVLESMIDELNKTGDYYSDEPSQVFPHYKNLYNNEIIYQNNLDQQVFNFILSILYFNAGLLDKSKYFIDIAKGNNDDLKLISNEIDSFSNKYLNNLSV